MNSRLKASTAPGTSLVLPIKAEGVTYEVQGQRLLQDLHFELSPGVRTAIIGPNGAGKTLTLRLLMGLLAPTAGSIHWAGAASLPGPRRMALMFQKPVLLRRSTLANVEYVLGLQGLPQPERQERAMHYLEQTGLASLAHRPARKLSGGQQQRLSLARAWALQPAVLFLDEPTASLDPAASKAVEDIVAAIAEGGCKTVLVTHDLGQARRLSDEVLFMHHGRLLAHQPTGPFFEQPATPEAQAFLAGELTW